MAPILFLAAVNCADDEPRKEVAALFGEPASAKFQAVRERGDYVCGQVNGRSRREAYSGYRRFLYDRRRKMALVDPAVAASAMSRQSVSLACGRPFAYQNVEERLACAEAPVQQAEAGRQAEFDALWLKACVP